jgi:mannose-1-phosphate guanylyltransferase
MQFVPASHEDPNNPGSLKKVLLHRADVIDGRVQMINWALLPVGKSFEAHYHQDMQEIFIIIEGKVEIMIDQENAELKAGDAVVIPIKSVHKMKNISDTDVVYIAMGISAEGKGKTINV